MESKEAIDEEKLKEGRLKEKTKKISIREGNAYSIMDGIGLRYITPYALALGASNTQIGFLTSIPSLLGNLSQLFTSRFMEKYSRKKIIVFSVFLQALMWIPLIVVGFFFFYRGLDVNVSSNLVILIYTILIIFGAFLSPAWNSLMSDIVSKEERGRYFGRRNKIVGAVALSALLIGGFILDYFKHTKLFIGFAILFEFAFIGRLISTYLLTKHYEPQLKFEKGYYFSFRKFLKKIPESNFGKFAFFVCLVMLATAIASPFFSVYMLKDLHFSYTFWTLIMISSSLSSLLFMPLWGRFADKYGNLKVIKITGMITPLVPFFWIVAPLIMKFNPSILIYYLFTTELISGAVWAGFNLSIVNFIYDAVTRQRVGLCVAYFNILSGVGVFVGATLGGLIGSMNFVIFGLTPLLFVFLVSGIARFAVYFFMIGKIKEVRSVQQYKKGALRKELREEFLYLSYKWIRPRPT